jgi:hypothetical protein
MYDPECAGGFDLRNLMDRVEACGDADSQQHRSNLRSARQRYLSKRISQVSIFPADDFYVLPSDVDTLVTQMHPFVLAKSEKEKTVILAFRATVSNHTLADCMSVTRTRHTDTSNAMMIVIHGKFQLRLHDW